MFILDTAKTECCQYPDCWKTVTLWLKVVFINLTWSAAKDANRGIKWRRRGGQEVTTERERERRDERQKEVTAVPAELPSIALPGRDVLIRNANIWPYLQLLEWHTQRSQLGEGVTCIRRRYVIKHTYRETNKVLINCWRNPITNTRNIICCLRSSDTLRYSHALHIVTSSCYTQAQRTLEPDWSWPVSVVTGQFYTHKQNQYQLVVTTENSDSSYKTLQLICS